jgi:alkaline phosphatase D
MRILTLSILLITLLSSGCQEENSQDFPKEYLIILSVDGFRWDYPDICNTPTLDSLRDAGVKAASMKPSFPTKTFPNHYTLATGLYPDHHGIVMNNFYAGDLDRDYNKGDKSTVQDGAFYSGEPAWITAEKQGLKSATLFWVGSEAPTDGIMPSYWKAYQHNLAFDDRIDTLEMWLNFRSDFRPRLVFWYLHEPDNFGHIYGPEGDSTRIMVEYLDNYLSHFFYRMRKLKFYEHINFIITSDHGMSQLSEDRQIILDDYVDTTMFEVIDGWNPNYNLKVKEGYLDKVYDALSNVPHLNVWKHGELPERLHYGHNNRTHDITLVPDPGWSVYWSWRIGKSKGAHGYDNDSKDMHTIFYGAGPAFKKGYVQPAFNNVDFYPLVIEILGLDPAANDGNIEHVRGMLN